MRIIFDPDIPEDIKEDLQRTIIDENIGESCKICGGDTLYVALIDNLLDVKCYECGYSFMEIELSEE
ncbi:MAG: hypothetical protein N2327_03170 [Caldimicrobium sp.]|nr:hypothetical protein [Caldimicrobium sp.]MCX7873423.1 hypothetical protein [Caldimicrobium sp.]MDW8094401.1 hypothetical protein [Caldimicrobium sp.]